MENRLLEYRKKANLTQIQLSNAIKISQSLISRVENNHTSMSFVTADRIASFFNMPIEEIFPEFGRISPYPKQES